MKDRPAGVRSILGVMCLVLLLGVTPSPAGRAAPFRFTIFDIPGAQSVWPDHINAAGHIVGTFRGPLPNRYHGFLRTGGGSVTFIDPRGAAVRGVLGPLYIDANGEVAGSFIEMRSGKEIIRGFARTAAGTVATFDAPGALRTYVGGINGAGRIAGAYVEQSGSSHGFIRTANGSFITFDVPGGFVRSGGVNDAGDVAGTFVRRKENLRTLGFIRAAAGSFTTFALDGFSPPPARYPPENPPLPPKISGFNSRGDIVGQYWEPSGRGREHGFLRAGEGLLSVVEPGGAIASGAFGVNGAGQIVGFFEDERRRSHGFLRSPAGVFEILDVPGAADTVAIDVNDAGQVVGFFTNGRDKSSSHGFIATR